MPTVVPAHFANHVWQPDHALRGVNLGGWLVLDRGITPHLFAGLKAPDEARFGEELGASKAKSRLQAHRDTFITDADFAWIATRGLNAVRIPVGYWVLEGDGPYQSATATLDRAFTQAHAHGLKVLLDLHGAPGSQNGWWHSGREGAHTWHTKKENIDRTLDVLEALAQRYGSKPNLAGIGLLNEPLWDVPLDILKNFYHAGYQRVRAHVKPQVAIVIDDAFRPFEWQNFLPSLEFSNVLLDAHLYHCYLDEDKKRTLPQHVEKAAINNRQYLLDIQKQLPVCVGGWSLALDSASVKGLDGFQLDSGRRAFGNAQLLTYENAQGWFFWTYKTEGAPEWSLRESVQRGWLPLRFA